MHIYIYIYIYIYILFCCGAATQRGSWPPHSWGFLGYTQRRTTVGRTPLDEWSAPRRDLYLTTHNTHNRQTSMTPVGFEPTISAGEQPQTYALDRAATGTGNMQILCMHNMFIIIIHIRSRLQVGRDLWRCACVWGRGCICNRYEQDLYRAVLQSSEKYLWSSPYCSYTANRIRYSDQPARSESLQNHGLTYSKFPL